MASNDTGTVSLLACEVGTALQPLEDRLSDGEIDRLLAELGLRPPSGFTEQAKIAEALANSASAAAELPKHVSDLSTAISNDEPAQILTATATLLKDVATIVKTLRKVAAEIEAGAASLPPAQQKQVKKFAKKLPRHLLDFLVIKYLDRTAPELLSSLTLAGLVDQENKAGSSKDPLSPPHQRRALRPKRLQNLVDDPKQYLKDTYNWGASNFNGTELFERLKTFLDEGDLPAAVINPPNGPPVLEAYVFRLRSNQSMSPPGLTLELRLPATQDYKNTFTLTDLWSLIFDVQARFDAGLKAEISPPFDASLKPPMPSGEANAALSISARAQRPGSTVTILGQSQGSRVQAKKIEGTLQFSAKWDSQSGEARATPSVEIGIDGGKVFIDVSEGDSFLQKVFPSKKIEGNFSLAGTWTPDAGVTVEGSAKIVQRVPTHITLGPLVLDALFFGLGLSKDGGFLLEASTGVSTSLGPLAVRVDRVGAEANLTVPENRNGNLGPVDLDLGFSPPSGLGLSVDAAVITGGGYIAFYPDEHRYSGTFELQITDLGITVVGLLKTKLPETDGFSLLLLITADLPPVQLGFGFVMTGIGGLGGVNRGFEEKPLGKAIRSGNVNSVLFPENVVANANQIITDLRSFFPARADQHVFGPMLEVGWGTPTILQMQLGVLVSIPTWKIAIVGNISMALPDEKAGLIVINLAVLGVLDLPNQELSIDASLYDSRIIKWSLSGDMSMRLSYGPDPRFFLSMGGTHPRYSPRKGIPRLQRVKASMSPPGGNPRLELSGYLAITPNTFQVGAKVTLAASAGPARVFGQLVFDALFRFNPFSFVVDFYATLKVKIKGKGLSISVDGTLSGPQPFRVKGKVKISILFFKATVRVNAQIGPAKKKEEKLPIAKILPKLTKQVAKPGSWNAQQPDEESQWVRLRDRHAGEKKNGKAPDSDLVLAHPRGTLGVRQQVVPLEMRIEKYGNAKPAHTTYQVVSLTVKNADAQKNLAGQKQLTEKFAPAKFRKMSDEEKLEAEAFEDLPAGRTLVNGLLHVAGAPPPGSSSNGGKFPLPKEATLDFEATAIDETNGEEQIKAGDLPQGTSWTTTQPSEIGQELKETSRVARGGMRTEGRARYRNDRDPNKLSVSDDRYVVVRKSTMERLKVSGTATKNPASGQPRVQALDAKKEYLDDHPDERGTLQVVATSEIAG
jgi:hypothetical protein